MIAKRALKMVTKLYVIDGDDNYDEYKWPLWARDNDGERSYTFSPEPGKTGWNTDGGCPGYGPPKKVLDEVIRRHNSHEDLVATLREAQQWIAAAADHQRHGDGPRWWLLKRINDVLERSA